MFPPSGKGVTLSLALDQAPFTRMTPAGTFCWSVGCVLLEKSPPLWGLLCAPALLPQANDKASKMITATKRKDLQCMVLLRHPKAIRPITRQINRASLSDVSNIEKPARHLRVSPGKSYRKTITVNAGSSA